MSSCVKKFHRLLEKLTKERPSPAAMPITYALGNSVATDDDVGSRGSEIALGDRHHPHAFFEDSFQIGDIFQSVHSYRRGFLWQNFDDFFSKPFLDLGIRCYAIQRDAGGVARLD